MKCAPHLRSVSTELGVRDLWLILSSHEVLSAVFKTKHNQTKTKQSHLGFNGTRKACPGEERFGLGAVLTAILKAVAGYAEAHEGGGAFVLDSADVVGRLSDVGEAVCFISIKPGAVYTCGSVGRKDISRCSLRDDMCIGMAECV